MNQIKYEDLEHEINKCLIKDYNSINSILLSENLFNIFSKELCKNDFKINKCFVYNDIVFICDDYIFSTNDNYAVIYLKNNYSYSVYVLSKNERIIKEIIE